MEEDVREQKATRRGKRLTQWEEDPGMGRGSWQDEVPGKKGRATQFSSVQSHLTLCNPVDCSTPGFPVHHQLPEPTQTHVRHVGDTIQPSHPLSSPSPPALNLSQHQGLFQWVNSFHEVAKVSEFSFNISASNEHPGPLSFRMDWLDLLAVQGTLKSLLQHHSLNRTSYKWNHTGFFFGVWLYSIGIIITRYPLLSSMCVFCVY